MRNVFALAALSLLPPLAAQNGASFLDAESSSIPYTVAQARPSADCSALVELTDAALSIILAEKVAASPQTPEFCRVRGVLAPEILFEVSLPTEWNGRLYMHGNGGYAGTPPEARNRVAIRNAALQRGFATAYTNTGHDREAEPLATFADNNLQKEIDYAFRAVHLTVQTAKRLAGLYYGDAPRFSYWDGCSTGGRQGLMSAQRFPEDFDGIIAGAPVLDFTGTVIWYHNIASALETAPLTLDDVRRVGQRVYARCDKLDGLEDGLIDDPRRCDFDPRRDLPRCGGSEGECFTEEQIEALARIYSPVPAGGRDPYPGLPLSAEAAPPGRPPGWYGWILREDGPSIQVVFMETFLRYLAFPVDDPDYDWRDFDPLEDAPKMARIRSMLDAVDPDLDRFRRRGGKILMHFGWADTALNPLRAIEYYEQVQQRSEGDARDFFRFFLVPGMFHCRGGVGPDQFDLMTPLIEWVEGGKAPHRLVASQTEQGRVVRTRKLCAYPEQARYDGVGDPNEQASFRCVSP